MSDPPRINSLGCLVGAIAIVLVLAISFIGPLLPLFMPWWFQH